MRRRLLLAVLPLILGLLCALAVPAGIAIAVERTNDVVRDRTVDADRFATELLRTTDPAVSRVSVELDQYAALHGTHAWIVDRNGVLVYVSPGAPDLAPTFDDVELRGVLAGRTPAEPATVWPWTKGDLRIIAPAGYDSGVVAAIVLAVPTASVRHDVSLAWLALGGAGLIAGIAAVAMLWPMTRWMLRPLESLERTAATMASGHFDARPPDSGGPPEMRALTRSFTEMADVVSKTLHRQRQFVSDASHQLRTPLAGVRVSVETLQPHVTPDGREAYRDATLALDRMNEVLTGLLEVTRDGAREHEPIDVAAAVESSVKRWRSAWGGTIHLNAEPGRVVPPGGGLEQVIDEVLNNAARHANARTISVRGVTDGPLYRIEIADDGIGLAPSEVGLATLRFWRHPRSQGTEGTGQGLAIIDELVAHAGGAVRVGAGSVSGLIVVIELRREGGSAD